LFRYSHYRDFTNKFRYIKIILICDLVPEKSSSIRPVPVRLYQNFTVYIFFKKMKVKLSKNTKKLLRVNVSSVVAKDIVKKKDNVTLIKVM
jgi:hypothetical protein